MKTFELKISTALLMSFVILSSSATGAPVYHTVLERDTDVGAGVEVFLASYNSLGDFLTNDIASSSFSQLDIGPNFSMGGFAVENDDVDVNPVPEPSTFALLGIGSIALVGYGVRRKKQAA